MNSSTNSPPSNPDQDPEHKPGWLRVVGSVLSAAIGIQSSKNHERDFKHGRARNFIITGIVFTVVFVATVFTVVSTVLKGSGVGH
jgi:hypothetical protein